MNRRIRAIIVDDEPLAIQLLVAKLAKWSHVEIVGQCKNGQEALACIADQCPDVMFLDIQMPGMSGLEVIKRVQGDIMPLVIFSTAYEQYALDAFDANAVDYILKPISDESLKRSIDRVTLRLLERSASQINKTSVMNAIAQMASAEKEESPSKIVVKDKDEIHMLNQREIEWIDAAGDYMCIHIGGKTHVKRITMKELLAELDESIFKRVHRSTIVNLKFVKKVIPLSKGEFHLVLGEYDQVKVSRNYRDVVKGFLAN
ncbi:LytTR family DNA-binding domain-containing protein [Glaciecola sp. XM2]|jgi:two-component system LytT family response regulator|uniref:LytR/AlgR family response regulator transcription factor n=1 Tax=Glaciecola sp. XM2 TaxID=1914931 RepID=UPI001BDEF102|nr:LytTR family DNA-binding domain-containing protein [Glaciecola sp. XM2]MBT1451110.1 LytTR family DNA-binding domain-containing protein [Glaciecola sp. XM2]